MNQYREEQRWTEARLDSCFKTLRLVVISDPHYGNPYHSPKHLKRSLEFVEKNDDVFAILAGDLCESVVKTSKGEIFNQVGSPRQQRDWLIDEALPPIKKKIIGMCTGNHEKRILKRAFEAELPSQIIKSVNEIFQYPKSWSQSECVVANTKFPFMVTHGDKRGISGSNLKSNPLLFGISVAYGHFHSCPSICHVETATQRLWGMHLGTCGIDKESYCFEYGAGSKFVPQNGCAVVLGDGTTPILIPQPD